MLIGVILLAGIVVNNAILLVQYVEIARRDDGLPLEQAVIEAGAVRMRPILMTTTTTVRRGHGISTEARDFAKRLKAIQTSP